MAVESAKAFCVRLMTDDDFREAICAATTAETISKLVADNGFSFTQHDMLKAVKEMSGKDVKKEELVALICEVYEEEIKSEDSTGSVEAVADWVRSLE